MSELVVRPAGPQDLAAIVDAVAGQPLLVRYGTSPEGLLGSLTQALDRREQILVAERAAQVAGLAWFLPAGTLALGGYLRLIAVAVGDEGRGTGARLLDEVEARTALESRHLFLLVSSFNQGARRFYERRGYLPVGELPGLVRPELDELLLWRRLR